MTASEARPNGLPVLVLPTGTIEIDGQTVTFRSLSRSEALQLGDFAGREDEAEDFLVACGMDVPIEEAREWRRSSDPLRAGLLVNEIIALSGLSDKSTPKV